MYQLSVIKNPTGTYSYVGSVPHCLGKEVKATRADVMGGRARKNSKGEMVTIKFPIFESKEAAVKFAAEKGEIAV